MSLDPVELKTDNINPCDITLLPHHQPIRIGHKLFIHPSLMYAKSHQSCLTLYDPIDYSLPGSSVHGISHTRILEWVAISASRGSS